MTEFKYADFATWWDQQTDIDDDSEALARRIFKAARCTEQAARAQADRQAPVASIDENGVLFAACMVRHIDPKGTSKEVLDRIINWEVAVNAEYAAQPTVAPSVAHRGGDAWISVEDRLPEIIEMYPGSGTGNSEPVLVCLEGEDNSGSVIAVWRYFRGGQGDTSSLYWDWPSPKVTHWMPLPAAPESTEDVAAGEKS